MNCYQYISSPGRKFALLIDPESMSVHSIIATIYAANESGVKMILVGGSLLTDKIDNAIEIIKKHTDLPVILFPGSLMQLSNKADAILLLSLVSGRNPDYLIGNHVIAAQYLKSSNLEIIPTGYILIDGGKVSSVEYVSNTKPIPSDKADLIVATAIASEMLGHKIIYLEAGSGAINSVNVNIIREVRKNVSVPLIVGGGIATPNQVNNIFEAGADIVVVGTAVEQDSDKLFTLIRAVQS